MWRTHAKMNIHLTQIALSIILAIIVARLPSQSMAAICGPGSTYEFAWQYETEYTVDLTIWRHKSSTGVETDIMYKYPDKDAMHYPGIFENRTEELPGFNAGMIVRDLHDTDTGNFSYEVTLNEVPVPIENFTDISVSLNGGILQLETLTAIRVNGTDIDRSKGSSIGSPSLTFEVDTTDACVPLPTITIYHNDTPKTQCDNTQCSYSVESAGDIYASVDLGTAYSGVQMPMFPLDTTRYTLFDPVQLAGSGKVMINDTLLNFTGPTHDYGPIYRPINMQYDISSTAPDISAPDITISLASVVQIKCIKKYICWAIIDEAGKIEIMVHFPGSSGPVTCPFTMESEDPVPSSSPPPSCSTGCIVGAVIGSIALLYS